MDHPIPSNARKHAAAAAADARADRQLDDDLLRPSLPAILSEGWRTVLAATAVALALGGAAIGRAERWTTTTLVRVDVAPPAQLAGSTVYSEFVEKTSTRLFDDERVYAAAVARAVTERRSPTLDVQVDQVAGGDMLSFTVVAPSRQAAVEGARRATADYLAARTERLRGDFVVAAEALDRGIAELDVEVAALAASPDPALTAERNARVDRRTTLQKQRDALTAAARAAEVDPGATIVEPAQPPLEPSSPRPLRELLIAGVLGVNVGVMLVLLRSWRGQGTPRSVATPLATDAADRTERASTVPPAVASGVAPSAEPDGEPAGRTAPLACSGDDQPADRRRPVAT